MITYKLFSNQDKVLHLPHVEELPLIEGSKGYVSAATILNNTFAKMYSNVFDETALSLKIDGAPAVVFGTHPENGKFFVGTKSVFNKKEPKICYTENDAWKHYGDNVPLLRKIMKCLAFLPKLKMEGVYQGDLLHTKDLYNVDENYIYVKPNTLVYGIKKTNPLYEKFQNSELGIIIHTEYVGNKLSELKGSLVIKELSYKPCNEVWMQSAYFTPKLKLTESESLTVNLKLDEVFNVNFNTTGYRNINTLVSSKKIVEFLRMFDNMLVKESLSFESMIDKFHTFVLWCHNKLNAEIKDIKTEETKANKRLIKEEILQYISINKGLFIRLFELSNLLAQTKGLILERLNKFEFDLECFLVNEDGNLIPTDHEGFVVLNKNTGDIVKLVNRQVFSKANFDNNKEFNLCPK